MMPNKVPVKIDMFVFISSPFLCCFYMMFCFLYFKYWKNLIFNFKYSICKGIHFIAVHN